MTPAGEAPMKLDPSSSGLNSLGRAFEPPCLVIAAPQGRSGKTTLSLGLCAALTRRGLAVQPFKKGPDYIDPSWLSEAAGRACRSLDTFFLPDSQSLRDAFIRGAFQADFALIEGNHGLYDSLEDDGSGSTAAVARTLSAPVLLVVNAARMSRSVAAMVHGYQTFEPDTRIAGVVLNNVAQGRHEAKLRQAIERHCRIPVVGALPRDAALTIPDRHLGLVPRGEDERLAPAIEACRSAVEAYVDLDAVLEIAGGQTASDYRPQTANLISRTPAPRLPTAASQPRIGVIRDRAFTFYYPENLEALEENGATLMFADALHDARLPEVDALYIGGGFPEMFMDALAENRSFRQDVRDAVRAGLAVFAECGGLMYLGQGIHYDGRYAQMAGALPYAVEMTARPQGHGYVLGEVEADTPFFPKGSQLRGHEFHHSRILPDGETRPGVTRLERGNGIGGQRDGLVYGNAYVGYTHLHAYGTPSWAPGLVAAARRRKEAL